MNLLLVSRDRELYKIFNELDLFDDISLTEVSDEVNYQADVILVSDDLMNFNELIFNQSMKKRKNNQPQIFYLLSNRYTKQTLENIHHSSTSHNITIISSDLTYKQMVESVVDKVFPYIKQTSNKIVSFFGADHKVGTTMLTTSVAETMAQYTNDRIGLLYLNGKLSTSYVKSHNKIGLDGLRIKLINNILGSEELLANCVKVEENFYVLPGVDHLLDFRHYHPEHIERLIELALENFDLLLIDAGSSIDSGLAIGALSKTKNKYLITTQQECTKKSFERLESQVFRRINIRPNDFMLVVNKYVKSNQMLTPRQLADHYNISLATQIPHLEFLGWQAEYDHKTLLHYNQESYNLQIKQLSKLIAIQTGIPFNDKEAIKLGFLHKAFQSLGGLY